MKITTFRDENAVIKANDDDLIFDMSKLKLTSMKEVHFQLIKGASAAFLTSCLSFIYLAPFLAPSPTLLIDDVYKSSEVNFCD